MPSAASSRCIADVELATLEWVDWYNNVRLHSHCEHLPPVEYDAQFHYRHKHNHDRERQIEWHAKGLEGSAR